MVKTAKAKIGITDRAATCSAQYHLFEVYNAGGVAKAAPLAFFSTHWNQAISWGGCNHASGAEGKLGFGASSACAEDL